MKRFTPWWRNCSRNFQGTLDSRMQIQGALRADRHMCRSFDRQVHIRDSFVFGHVWVEFHSLQEERKVAGLLPALR